MNDKKDKLYIPQGTESLHMDEAFTHRAFIRDMEDNFLKWGYLPVQTPVIDYFDDYQHLMTSGHMDEIYRLIDREGELLMLRSDITLFLARQLSISLTKESLPVRAYYADTILRYQDKEDISHNEFFQVGCELIGKNSLEGDLEVLLLAKEQLESLGLETFKMHIGSRSIFNKLTRKLTPKEITELLLHLNERYRQGMTSIFNHYFTADQSLELVDFFLSIVAVKDFDLLIAKVPEWIGLLISEDIEYLRSLTTELIALDEKNHIRIDFSETGNQSYYSGIVFQCYAEGADSAIVSGGRYNGLIKCQGENVSSFGFSIYQRKIESLLPSKEIPLGERLNREGSFYERFQEAEKLRKQNKRVIL